MEFLGFKEKDSEAQRVKLEGWWKEPLLSWAVLAQLLSYVRLFATPWTATHHVPLSMGFSRQEYCSGLPFPPLGIFPTQGSNPGLLRCRWVLYRLSQQGGPSVLNFLLGGKSVQQEAECWNWVILPQAAWSPVCRGRGIRRGGPAGDDAEETKQVSVCTSTGKSREEG